MLPDVPLLFPVLLDGVRMIDSVPPESCGVTFCWADAGAALANTTATVNIPVRISTLLDFRP